MSTAEKAAIQPQSLTVRVTLDVTTRAVVEIRTDSSKTVDDMRQSALKKFDEAGGTEYRNQFRSNTAISLVSTEVKVGELRTVAPEREW